MQPKPDALSTPVASFDPDDFTITHFETPEAVAALRDETVAFYRPANSQELFAVESIALAKLSLRRCAALQAGFFAACLKAGTEPAGGQNHASWFGKSGSFALFLRYQAQSEERYRSAVEDFDRLRSLRSQLASQPAVDTKPQTAAPAPQTSPSTRRRKNTRTLESYPCPKLIM